MIKNQSAHPAQLLNHTVSKFCHSSYMVMTLHNSKILLSLLLLSHSTILNFYHSANCIFLVLVIPLRYVGDRWKETVLCQLKLLLLVILLCSCHTILFVLDICLNKKAPPTHSVHWGLNSFQITSPPLFCQGPF